jgi:chromosome segregation ATPase
LAARLLTDLNKVDSLRGSQTLSTDKATELQDWLTKKLKSVHESLAEVAETRIDRAIEDAAATLDDEDDAQVVITALQQQVTDAAEETDRVRQELETTRERLTEVEGQVAILESERDTAQERVSELEAELEQAQEGLSIAEATIAGLTTADVADEDESDEVTEAVDAAIAQNPDLTPYRARLMECVTPDEVLAEVEHLRPAPPPEDPEPPVAQRRTLPPRGVVVESESRAGTTRPNTVGSTGARMAGKALGKMKASTR